MAEEVKTNIEEIIVKFQQSSELEMRKFNGITIEFVIPEDSTFKKCKTAVNRLCKQNKLLPVSIEESKVSTTRFTAEFIELEPYYTDEQNTSMYNDSIHWLIDNFIKSTQFQPGVKVTKQMLLDSADSFVMEAMKIYYKSNMNPYKVTIEHFLQDVKYRSTIDKLFRAIVSQYDLPIR